MNTNIAMSGQGIEVPDQVNALAKVLQLQAAQGQNQLQQYTLSKAQRMDAGTNALFSALRDGKLDLSTPEGQNQAYQIGGEAAMPVIKNYLDGKQSASIIDKNKGDAAKSQEEVFKQRTQFFKDRIPNVPSQVPAFYDAMYSDPVIGASMQRTLPKEQALTSVPTDPKAFQQWRQEFALGAPKFIELNAPKTTVVPAGGVSQVLQTPGLGGAPQTVAQVQHTVSPDAVLQANTSRANNRDTIAGENMRMGVTPGGGLDDNSERTAQAIANGQLPAPTGMALLNPKNQRILGRVMEINPQYDATTVSAKKKAASDFTSGTLGNSLRSFAVAGQHLDQLGQLADALDNGNLQLVNKIGNAVAAQTGSAAPTNFNAAKDIVSKEVMKAIVAGGGGVAEREELNRTMSAANSPKQLKGVIQQYRNLMAAQHDALLQQRRAAGLPDSTLPAYSTGNDTPAAAPAAPPGWGIQRVN